MKPDGTIMQPGGSDQDICKQIRILLVEDVANVAAVLKTRLETFNYIICDIANTGRKAIDCAMRHKPDLILMDIMLEGDMNGIEAAEIISKKLDVPIIYLSCLNDQKVFDRAIETKPYGYILKPYDSSELRFSIENAIRIHRLDKKHKARIAELEKRCADSDAST